MLRYICKLLTGVMLLLSIAGVVVSADVNVPKPNIVKGEKCVEPTEFMRRYHMDILMHQRDNTVIHGVRSDKHSLVGCISCHADKNSTGDYIPVNAEGQFCQSCHSYAAVKVDCFQCHATVPAE
ncbi:MAG: putative CXXCH cytochrome family protein [Parasphingorhabdus sp.]|jgi:predicted CXXCH cytochrome family protein